MLNNFNVENKQAKNDVDISKSDGKSCHLCGVTFTTLEEQVHKLHFNNLTVGKK